MTVVASVAAAAIAILILSSLVQIARGKTVLDRLLATALAAANSLVLLMLLGFVFDRVSFFGDIGLAYALLAFLFPIAFARYLEAEANKAKGGSGSLTPDDEGSGS
jgi:multisubunit Na+/H+ antiporter MnhF subunit